MRTRQNLKVYQYSQHRPPDIVTAGLVGDVEFEDTRNRFLTQSQRQIVALLAFLLVVGFYASYNALDSPSNAIDHGVQSQENRLGELLRSNGQKKTIHVGYCASDNLAFFAKEVGSALAARLNRSPIFISLQVNGDEQSMDFVFCERGSTQMVERKLNAGSRELIHISHDPLDRLPPIPRVMVPKPGRLKTVVDSSTGRVVRKPFIVRYHMEPWITLPAEGVNIALDCKTNKENLAPNQVLLHVPYFYVSYAHRAERYRPAHLLVSGNGVNFDRDKYHERRFMGFLASYCKARLPSGIFRTMAFNLITEAFQDEAKCTEAIGNCQPRTVRDRNPWFRLQAAPNLVHPDMFQAAIDAFKKFKFVLTFENTQNPGYITEKIINAKLAGAIPIYWGAPDVDTYLNTKAFIWCNISTKGIDWFKLVKHAESKLQRKAHSDDIIDMVERDALDLLGGAHVFQHCVDEIRRLDTDEDAYFEMVRQPILKSADVVDPDVYADRILQIYDKIFTDH